MSTVCLGILIIYRKLKLKWNSLTFIEGWQVNDVKCVKVYYWLIPPISFLSLFIVSQSLFQRDPDQGLAIKSKLTIQNVPLAWLLHLQMYSTNIKLYKISIIYEFLKRCIIFNDNEPLLCPYTIIVFSKTYTELAFVKNSHPHK